MMDIQVGALEIVGIVNDVAIIHTHESASHFVSQCPVTKSCLDIFHGIFAPLHRWRVFEIGQHSLEVLGAPVPAKAISHPLDEVRVSTVAQPVDFFKHLVQDKPSLNAIYLVGGKRQ